MADSTLWTLRAMDHDGTTIKFIPESSDEANAATSPYYYYHLQDGGFDINSPKKKRLWAGKSNVEKMGEDLISESYENRTIKMQLMIKASDLEYVITAFKELHQFAEECGRYASVPPFVNGYWYIKKQWLGVPDTTFAYIVIMAADVSPLPNLYGQEGVQFKAGGVYSVPVSITFITEPAWRDTAPFADGTTVVNGITIGNDSGTYNNYVTITKTDITGDLPPLLLIRVKSEENKSFRRVHLSVHSTARISSYPDVRLEAEDMTLTNDAALMAIATSSGGQILNGSFEKGTHGVTPTWDNWTKAAGDGSIYEDSYGYRGKYHAVTKAGASANTYIYQQFATSHSQTYKYNFLHKGDGIDNGRYGVYDVTNSNWITAINSTGLTSSTSWHARMSEFTTAGNTDAVQFRFYCPTTNLSDADWDNLNIDSAVLIPSGMASIEAKRLRETVTLENNIGTFRLKLSVQCADGIDKDDVGFRAEYTIGSQTMDVGDGQWKYRTVTNDNWQFVDLGKVSLEYAKVFPYSTGSKTDILFDIYTKHATDTKECKIDYLELVPLSSGGYGWVEFTGSITDSGMAVIDQRIPGVSVLYSQAYVGAAASYMSSIAKDSDLPLLQLVPGNAYDSRIYFSGDFNVGSNLDTRPVTEATFYIYLTKRFLTVA